MRKGCKVVLVTTHASNWIVGMDAVHGNPYDGATLKGALTQTERLTTIMPRQAAVDKGFRGVDYHPPDVEVLVAGTRFPPTPQGTQAPAQTTQCH